MIWLDALYRCPLGHEHRIIVGRARPALELAHGIVDGKLPTCRMPLALIATKVRLS